jgi:hypothetical protein
MNVSMRALCNKFHKKIIEKAPYKTNAKAWSRAVFPILAEMAVDYDFCCWTRKRYIPANLLGKIKKINGEDPYEFVVDMCWTKVDWRNEYEKRIEVAIECEWGQSLKELELDFAKLLHINAPRKIFVYDSGIKNQKIKEENLKKMVDNYDSNRLFQGDQILLIDLNRKNIKYT